MNNKQSKDQDHLTWFRHASPYINLHRGSRVVLHFHGDLLETELVTSLFHDIALLHSLGIHLILVHGVAPQIEQRCKAHQLDTKFHNGIRITDHKVLPHAIDAVGNTRIEIEARLSNSLPNTPMSGSRLAISSGNFITAKPLGVQQGIDFCHSGKLRRLDVTGIADQLKLGNLVLLSPLGYSPTGEIFNLSSTELATEAAVALHANKLIFLKPGDFIRDANKAVISQLTPSDIDKISQTEPELLQQEQLYFQHAQHACRHGVARTHILSDQIDGVLLQELFTRDGAGTLVSTELPETLRTAKIEDVAGILELITPQEEAGVLVRRSREQLEVEIANFHVIEKENTIIACAALYPDHVESIAELACIAVHPDYCNHGRGERLLKRLENVANTLDIKRLLVLTTQTAHWFLERSFSEGKINDLPIKKRKLYNLQRQSKVYYKNLV